MLISIRVMRIILLGIILCATSSIAYSADTSLASQSSSTNYIYDYANFEKDRDDFLRIEKQIWKLDDNEFARLIKGIQDYPLVPYLLERRILHNLRVRKAPQVREFISQYEGTVLENRVRRPWLRHLAKYNRKTLFNEFYRPTGNARLTCRYLSYQLEDVKNGKAHISEKEIFEQTEKLWNISKSQHKECDPVFKQWIKRGGLSEAIILQRIEKTAKGGQHTLIPYLKTLLPSDKQYLADLWYSMRRSPSNVKYLNRFKGKYPGIEAEIASYAFGRLIWRDDELALRIWEKAKTKIVFNNKQLAHVAARFAISLAIDDHQSAEQWAITSEALNKDPEVLRWHMADLLRDQSWASLINLIEKSAPELTAANEYQYWLARAYEQTGNSQKANELYQQLSQERHYYGFLASARLDQPVNLQNQPIAPDPELIKTILQHDSAKRAFELRALERYHEARLEWRHLQSELSEDETLVSSVIASEWGWHDQAIFGFTRSGYLNDVERRFPIAYEDIMVKEARKNQVDPTWAFAIARRESSFMSDAVSSANARGLMQVLPSTAKYIEKKRVSSRQLLNPKINAKLGNKYLRYLLDKLDDNSILATASYNAGWHRVRKWLPDDEAIEADLWIETIPFKETRNYVKAVMAYKQIYQEHFNQRQINKVVKQDDSVFSQVIDTQIPVSI